MPPKSPRPQPQRRPSATAPKPTAPFAAVGTALVGFLLAAGVTASIFGESGCRREPPPGAAPQPSASAAPLATTAQPSPPPPPATPDAGDAHDASAPDAAKAYDGPLIGATSMQAPIFSAMDWSKEKRIGYLRHGGKAPVEPTALRAGNCEAGWYKLVGGGYVCGKHATLDLNQPQVRLGTTAPNLEEVLPYRYAFNTTMGTPLYRSVPSREEMLRYEPYLKGARKHREREREHVADDAPPGAPPPALSDDLDAGAPGAAASADAGAEAKRAWWQEAGDGGKPPDIKLSDLTEGADEVVAKRMVKGFFVAIDKTFGWNGRLWYRTTTGLVAPADRFAVTKPPTFHGLELAGTDPKQPVAFVLSTKAHKYDVTGDGDRRKVEVKGSVERFTITRLTGKTAQVVGIVYRETTEGWWMKSIEGTYTDPGAPPEGLAAGEKWVDVNLSRQTLVAFEGDVPVYATLVSTGRKGKDKLHDHTTIKGSFRVREKHIATTMDGDGPAPGDMPYSIEDVPYVMYFEGSYALHGAFWHNNFGHEQSHGCVNLAPLDAKRVFFFTDPPLPEGWHGVVAQRSSPGSRVVVHD